MTSTLDAVQSARAHIAHIGRLLFDRRLTDAAGGNISVRVGDVVCISPRYSGSQRQWQLDPDDVLVVDKAGNVLEGEGVVSRESRVHLKLHTEFADAGTAVIHAHPRHLLVFCTMAQPMPPVMEATRKFGITPVAEYAPAHSPKLAEHVAAQLRGREAIIRKHAAAVIAPWHGLFLMGKDLDFAFDAVERLENNAYCMLMGAQWMGKEAFTALNAHMESIISNFTE